jgi:streptomycin 3"-adenylyltransferase
MRRMDEVELEPVLAALRDALGDDLLGVYLHGSSVLGGLRRWSDLDLFVVSSGRLAHDQKRRLGDRLLAVSGMPPDRRPVEVTVVAASEVRPWRYPPTMELQYGEWLRAGFEAGHVEPPSGPHPDLALAVANVLQGNRCLVGPPPEKILDPIPPQDLADAMVADIPRLLDDLESDTRNVILTLVRIWDSLETGGIRSKDAAADRIAERLPEEHRAVVARARAIYLGDEEERWDDLMARVPPCATYLVAEIERLR